MKGTILERIVESKRAELESTRQRRPLREVLAFLADRPAPKSMAAQLRRPGINIISEIKYRSPSRGEFACRLEPHELAKIYAENGAAAISILTEESFFGGKLDFLSRVATSDCGLPLLRKDFLIDPYQIAESAAAGASAALLIVACLGATELESLLGAARDFGIETLVEIHDEPELETALEAGAQIVGVNNRDLKTFEVRVQTSFEIARRMEGIEGFTLVSESGIEDPILIGELRDAGYSGFLVGGTLMDSVDPGAALRRLAGLPARKEH